MFDREIFELINTSAYYNIIWINFLYIITICRIILPGFNERIETYDGNLSELTGLPLVLMHTVAFLYGIYKYDVLSTVLFSYWGPCFLVVAYIYTQIKKNNMRFNWKPFGLPSSYLCKVMYLVFVAIYMYYELYEAIYFFSVWIMHDQIHLIWFHNNADRTRRTFEDGWIFRLCYPALLFISLFVNTRADTYLLILGVAVLIGWLLSLVKIINENEFYRKPENLEYLRNIVYLDDSYKDVISGKTRHHPLIDQIIKFLISEYKFEYVNESVLNWYNNSLKQFEKKMEQRYALGDKTFTINHGDNYFDFFKRIGKTHYYLIRHHNEIIGTGCAILKTKKAHKFWYLCDLKIDPQHRKRNLTRKLFMKMFGQFISESSSGYLVTMNTNPMTNPVFSIFRKMTTLCGFNLRYATLLIYQIDIDNYNKIYKLLCDFYQSRLSFVKLNGIKDIVVENQPLNLYHLHHNSDNTDNETTVISDTTTAIIMFSCLENSSLSDKLQEIGITTNTKATIIYNNMDFYNWNHIVTSEI